MSAAASPTISITEAPPTPKKKRARTKKTTTTTKGPKIKKEGSESRRSRLRHHSLLKAVEFYESEPSQARARRALSPYTRFLRRPAPKALGSKHWPEGTPDCLKGLTFVITGVLSAFEREDVKHGIQKLGGQVRSAVSGRTDYLVVGDEPGDHKLGVVSQLKPFQTFFVFIFTYFSKNKKWRGFK